MGITPIAISSPYLNPALQGQSAQLYAQQRVAAQASSVQDTVHLSELAQIHQMSQQGESASTIASTTGLTVSEVDSDLGISSSSSSFPAISINIPGGGGQAASAGASKTASSSSSLSVQA